MLLPDLTGDMPGMLRALVQPDVELTTFKGAGQHGETIHCLTHAPSGSWARLTAQGDGTAQVEHDGPRDLVAEDAPVLDHWATHDRPGPGQYGFTVFPDGEHRLWFEGTDGTSWPLPHAEG